MAKLAGKITSLSATVQAQMGQNASGGSTTVTGGATGWFGPSNPLSPVAPPGVAGRRWDYPFGLNLQYQPRSTEAIGFGDLRALADSLPVLRAVIETRKDQIAALPWTLRAVPDEGLTKRKQAQSVTPAQRAVVADLKAFLRRPDGCTPFDTWMRSILEDMLVIDAACIYPRPTLGGGLYSLDVIDGATIKPLIDETGRRPEPPEPAYQQILKGVVAADFTSEELLYLPRNVRSSRIYGFSPVEQIVMTINIALRRDVAVLEHYRSGTVPDSFGTLPKEWTMDQIRQFQDYTDSLMAGNTQARAGMKFMPFDFKYTPTREPPMKDVYDEWLARLICYVFSVPPTPFVAHVNRATAETAEQQAREEGLVPLQQWIKHFMDHVVQVLLGQPEYEFTWSDGDQVDPAVQMSVLTSYVNAGVKSRDEVREELGDDPIEDGTGGDYTVSGQLSPARLPTPEEQAQAHAQAMALSQAKGFGEPGADGADPGAEGDAPPPDDPAAEDVEKMRARIAEILAKEWDESKHPRGQPNNAGQFAPKAGGSASAPKSKDTRPRDENGRFVYNGGMSRGPTSAAGRRNRLIEGIKNASERAVVGAALAGGAQLAMHVFAPQAGAGLLAINIARAVGVAALGEAAAAAVTSGMTYLGLPESISESVHTAVTLGLGIYGVADAKDNLDTYMRQKYPYSQRAAARDKKDGRTGQQKLEAKGRSKAVATKMLGKAAEEGEATHDEALDAVKAALYHYGQETIERLKAEAAKKAKRGDGAKLGEVNDGLEEALEDFLDHVDRIGGAPEPEPGPGDGKDEGSAGEHPVEDVSDHPIVDKLAKADPWRFTEGGARNSLDKFAKAVNWKALEPMWQKPAHEARAVSRYRRVLTAAFAKAAPKVADFVRERLGKALGGELRKDDISDDLPLDDITDAAGDLADISEGVAGEVSRGALARVGVGTGNDDIVNAVSARAVAQARARAGELVGMSWDEESQSFVDNPNPDMAITENTREMIRDIISNGLADNLSADEIADQIEQSTAFSPERADLVAKTEITRINSEAALGAYRDAAAAGVQVKKRWIVAATDVCDDCTLNAKQGPIALDEAFQSGDMSPPQHPNCRCAVAPVVSMPDSGEDLESED